MVGSRLRELPMRTHLQQPYPQAAAFIKKALKSGSLTRIR